MATAKIATLLIRTLAKPIATQLKTQAASHPSFRKVCVGLAQGMHRTEMALRYNLLPKAARLPPREQHHEPEEGDAEHKKEDGSSSSSSSSSSQRPRVRPLNEAKAIAQGANFISEAFLFSIAAGLILGENWRSKAKSRDHRERIEESVEELAERIKGLEAKLGGEVEQQGTSRSIDQGEEERRRLQAAVDLLLRMAIKQGSIAGPEALDLKGILDGKEQQPATQESASSSTSNKDNEQEVYRKPASILYERGNALPQS